jgi:dephospho-CoA kinase
MKIGITGGIGSGKSTVLNLFVELGGIPYFADKRAKWLIENNLTIRQNIINLFGEKSYQNNKYNSPWIASIVFKNKYLLQCLNHIVHPAVWQDFDAFCMENPEKIIFYEAALIFENNNQHLFDKTILVTAPIQTKKERIKKRDSISETQIQARMTNQLSDEEKRPLADYEIVNTELESTRKQVLEIYEKIIALRH